jgi:hypothetical protein
MRTRAAGMILLSLSALAVLACATPTARPAHRRGAWAASLARPIQAERLRGMLVVRPQIAGGTLGVSVQVEKKSRAIADHRPARRAPSDAALLGGFGLILVGVTLVNLADR